MKLSATLFYLIYRLILRIGDLRLLQNRYSSSLLALIFSFARSTARSTCSLVKKRRPGVSHGGGSSGALASGICVNCACAKNHIDTNLQQRMHTIAVRSFVSWFWTDKFLSHSKQEVLVRIERETSTLCMYTDLLCTHYWMFCTVRTDVGDSTLTIL